MAASIENVEIRQNLPDKGKGLFSNRHIEEDEVIFEERPVVSCQFLWNQMYKYKACDFCMASLETAQEMAQRLSGNAELVLPHPACCTVKTESHCRCDACGVEYCSVECRDKAWRTFHESLCLGQSVQDPEHPINKLCDMWRGMHYPPETCSIMLMARMVATVTQSKERDAVLAQLSELCKATFNDKEQFGHKLLGDKFQEQIELLRTTAAESLCNEHVEQWFIPDGFQSVIAMIGTNGQGIGTSSLSVWVKNCDDLDLEEDVRTQLDHMIDQLYDDMDRVSGQFLNCEGSGLYYLQSACNHSCSPNAEVTFPHNNNILALKALKPIPQGEEICISYLDECQLDRSRHSRQKSLRENYIFTCQCPKCISQADEADCTSSGDEEMEES